MGFDMCVSGRPLARYNRNEKSQWAKMYSVSSERSYNWQQEGYEEDIELIEIDNFSEFAKKVYQSRQNAIILAYTSWKEDYQKLYDHLIFMLRQRTSVEDGKPVPAIAKLNLKTTNTDHFPLSNNRDENIIAILRYSNGLQTNFIVNVLPQDKPINITNEINNSDLIW
ncbi:hypothetical protein GJ496_001408 [Pomphorhynchus laevis]|nr:hypothetical protein GJ496_001408 [Pomphorhynchus laevis]